MLVRLANALYVSSASGGDSGGSHGRLLARQLLDVVVRVESVRAFAVAQMAPLLCDGRIARTAAAAAQALIVRPQHAHKKGQDSKSEAAEMDQGFDLGGDGDGPSYLPQKPVACDRSAALHVVCVCAGDANV